MSVLRNIPVETLHLFPVLDKMLHELLRSLSPADWQRKTIASKWVIKDIVAHMLDTNMRTISLIRDKHSMPAPDQPIEGYASLVQYLNELNAVWVNAWKRVSPRILLELLEGSNQLYYESLMRLDPFEPAIYPVAWAGQNRSENWFHIAREYTEKFIHQMQIREALGRNELYETSLYQPFIRTFMYALPHCMRDTLALNGTRVSVLVSSDAGGCWTTEKQAGGWVSVEADPEAENSVTLRPDTAWKLFSKGISPKQALPEVEIRGNTELVRTAMGMVSVMA